MFIVTSRYTASPEAIAAALPDHRVWVADLYERGVFVLSGRLVPFVGGFMLARDVTRPELEAILGADPFRLAGLLEHAIVEVHPTQWAPALAVLSEAP